MLHVRDILPRERPRPKKSQASELEERFLFDVRARRLPEPERQHRFAQSVGRQWRLDFSWQPFMLAVEIDGLVVRQVGGEMVTMGRHASAAGMREDMTKGNAAILLGWAVLHFERNLVMSGEAVDVTYRVLAARGWSGAR